MTKKMTTIDEELMNEFSFFEMPVQQTLDWCCAYVKLYVLFGPLFLCLRALKNIMFSGGDPLAVDFVNDMFVTHVLCH